MIILDTDTVSLLFGNHPRVVDRYRTATDDVAITIISRIEVLQGRFATILKAANRKELEKAQHRLDQAESDLATLSAFPIDASAAARFDELRLNKKLKQIGRADMLIASIALAKNATLVTRNVRHFKQVPNLKVENWAD